MSKTLAFVFLLGIVINLSAQEKKAGPIIQDFGKVWVIENPDYQVRTNAELKVVFDIMNSPDDLTKSNASIETAARFLNMHGQSGVSKEHMKVALVVHNKASKDIITNEAYEARYGVENPNSKMVQQLMDAGVEFIFCGQSSFSRSFPIEETISGVQLSLSAMTALIQLQNDGYRLIKF
ncbi:DsrE family protein [Croceitalea rosinachiae]|uniref:DsrE family protein n=1 Tax=Croceitalea rosinachiae TaxID=3075596 RepID=A0ABU3AC03_9FLAO|nr:DsrE family protein [Croceitalea sp. F388]MDT0607703.1 DsrE family protein [Croceitalea sp. F388]